MAGVLSIIAAGSILSVLAVRAFYAFHSGYYVGWVSGVWLGLARDLASGVFYRPLISDAGYGGTRYMPLFFTLVAGLLKAGFAPLTAGFIVGILAAASLAAALMAWMKHRGLPVASRALVGALALAPYFVQETIFELRSDVLAAGLEIWGLVLIVAARKEDSSRPANGRLALAALCFALAWVTKVTAVAGLVAAVGALWFDGRRPAARRVVSLTLAAYAVSALIIQAASHGHAWEAFQAGAATGFNAVNALAALVAPGPLVLVSHSLFLQLTFALAVAALIWDRHGVLRDPAAWFLALSVFSTVLLLTSPGTTLRNHVVEPYAAALVVIGVWMARSPDRQLTGALVFSALAVISTQHVIRDPATAAMVRSVTSIPADREALIQAVGRFKSPVFSESAVYPVMTGVRPYVADPFALKVIVSERPDILADLLSKLDRRFFPFVVLEHDPDSPEGAGLYAGLHLGPAVIARVKANYRLDRAIGSSRVYIPRLPVAQ